MVRAGRVKPLTLTGTKRAALFPDVPTVAESDCPYAVLWLWFGLFAPGGASRQVVDRIHRDVTAILKRPEFIEAYITKFSLDLIANSPAEFAEAIRADVTSIGEMVKAAGARPE